MTGGVGASMASAFTHQGVALHSGPDADDLKDDTTGDTGIPSVTITMPQNKVNEPARQVPVEPLQEAPQEPLKEGVRNDAGTPPDEKSGKPSDADIPSPDQRSWTQPGPKPQSPPDSGKASAKEPLGSGPGIPVRKPRKPLYKLKKNQKKDSKNPSLSRSARDRALCKALQKCRNAFIKCKSKIKHPDQSEPWIVAKEVCGGHYKTCVEKDFQAGEWFLTRWFYFKELNCGG